MRIVSLLSSSTEMVYALGMERFLVGRSHECDFPPEVLRLPQCTETKFAADGTSYQIDQRIKAILQEGLSVYRVLSDRLMNLRPEVILTQMQCEVCAVSEKDVEAAVCEWTGLAPKILSLNTNCLEDFWKDLRRVAGALEIPEKGEELVLRLQERMTELSRRALASSRRPRVACIEWMDPLMTAGNWMPELIEMSGGVSIFGEAGKHSPWLTWKELEGADPDLILILPCGWGIPKILTEMPSLLRHPEWPRLRAVREGQVFLADGNQFFNRPGPRLVESLQILCEIVHPEEFAPKFEEIAWKRYCL